MSDKELWKRAYHVYADFKSICHEINGTRRKRGRKKKIMLTERIMPTERLKCGCEPHGHKCLVIEGGCGRCVEHCICRLREILTTLKEKGYSKEQIMEAL